jgi:RNA polymerase sigma-70 factor (ECF subfamily)
MSTVTGGPPPAAPAVSGGGASFESLLLPLLDSAYGAALRLTRHAADAEDLVQEAAVQACRGFGTFELGTNFRAWYFRILTNCFYSRYRRTRREGTQVELEDVPDLYLFTQTAALGLHARTQDPAAALLDRLDAEAVSQAIEALPEEYRVAAVLYFLQDCSYLEIAEILGVPVGTVRSRLHRGRRLLQKALWTIAEERGITAALRQKGGRDD